MINPLFRIMFRYFAWLFVLPGAIGWAIVGDIEQAIGTGLMFLGALWFSSLYRLVCPRCLRRSIGFRNQHCPHCGIPLQEE